MSKFGRNSMRRKIKRLLSFNESQSSERQFTKSHSEDTFDPISLLDNNSNCCRKGNYSRSTAPALRMSQSFTAGDFNAVKSPVSICHTKETNPILSDSDHGDIVNCYNYRAIVLFHQVVNFR